MTKVLSVHGCWVPEPPAQAGTCTLRLNPAYYDHRTQCIASTRLPENLSNKTRALFSSEKISDFVAISFLFDKYCPIIN